jgi:hypothetical protein
MDDFVELINFGYIERLLEFFIIRLNEIDEDLAILEGATINSNLEVGV